MQTTYLGLGSNLDDRLGYLARGIALLGASGDPALAAVSGVYETAPWGKTDVPAYLNCAVAVRTALPPRELLRRCLEVEAACGRVRGERWDSRTLDIDVLLYGHVTLTEPELQVPHPRLAERAFVLVPLAELAPELRLPDGRRVQDLLESVSDQGVALYLPAARFRAAVVAAAGPG